MSRSPILSLGIILAIGLVGACGPVQPPGAVTMSTGMADSAEGAIIVEADGHTYKIPLDVEWTGLDGLRHSGDRPGCLPPGALVPVQFAWVEVTVESATWRQVLWVDCRG